MLIPSSRSTLFAVVLTATVAATACSSSSSSMPADETGKIPVTTSSDEARALYLEAQTLSDNIDATDAYLKYQEAAAADPNFALAYVGMANTAPSTDAFVDAVEQAVQHADGVSEGERHMILAQQAGMQSDPAGQMEHATALLSLHPDDERAHMLVGTLYFGRQDYATAATHYQHAVDINANFAPVYNMLGYAERFQDNPDAAEAAFQKYIELIPNDPNPHDSYAEFLMEVGRFDESIQHYERAIELDANWVNGYVGIGNNQIFKGEFDAARATFAQELDAARNNGERRQAHNWIAAAYLHEGNFDAAIAEIEKAKALSQADGDLATVAGDEGQIASMLREAGRYDESLARFATSLEVINGADDVPAQFKETAERNAIYQQGRVAAARGDLETARARLEAYTQAISTRTAPFETRQQHELAGMIALAADDDATALAELAQANQRDPLVLFMMAMAHEGAGDMDAAKEAAAEVADFNSLAFNLGYVKAKADAMAER